MDNMEIRFMTSDIETTDDGTMLVEGLVNRTDAWSNELGQRRKFKEKINKGAFAQALIEATRIDFLMEHDPTKLLSTTQNGSLKLYEDEEGLKMRAEIVPTTYGKDLYALMKSKIINHMSFGFKVVNDKWTKLADGTYRREVNALKLFEVSAVRNPAYPQSLISARGLHVVENEDEIIPESLDEVRSDEQVEQISEQPVVQAEVQQTVEEPVAVVVTEPIITQPVVQPTVEAVNEPQIQAEQPQQEVKVESGVTLEQFNQLMNLVTDLSGKIDKVVAEKQPEQTPQTPVEVKKEVKQTPDLSAFYQKIKQVKEF